MSPVLRGDPRQTIVDALSSPLQLKEALRLVAGIVLEGARADHVSIFLLEAGHLLPAVALRKDPSAEAWQAMKSLGPIRLTREGTAQFASGMPVVVDDARSSPLIDREVADRFSLRSLVMIAMRADDRVCGIMAAGRDELEPFSACDVSVLTKLSCHAARAVITARPFEVLRRRAELQEALATSYSALAEDLDEPEFVHRLAEGFSAVVRSSTCAVALVSGERVRVLTARPGGHRDRIAEIALADLPPRIVATVEKAWVGTPNPGGVEVEGDAEISALIGEPSMGDVRHLLLPLLVYDKVAGAAVLCIPHGLDAASEELAAAETLASMGSAALERHLLLKGLRGHVDQLEGLLSTIGARASNESSACRLTPSERRVAELVADGLTNIEIAGELQVSLGTVKTHVHRVLNKLGATSRTEAALLHIRGSVASHVADNDVRKSIQR